MRRPARRAPKPWKSIWQVLEKLKQDHIDEKDRQAALQIKTETDKLKRANNMAVSKEEIEIKTSRFPENMTN